MQRKTNGPTRQGNNVISMDDHVMSSNDCGPLPFSERYTDVLDATDDSSTFDKVFFERPSEMLDTLNLGRTLFELREYRKCAHTLDKIKDQS